VVDRAALAAELPLKLAWREEQSGQVDQIV
jgi:hypothetical protein